MKNKYLITGGSGFVGSNIVRSLVEKGERVGVIVRNKKLSWRIEDLVSKIDIYESDILSSSLEAIVKKIRPDFVFHLAAYGVLPQERDTEKMVDINIKGTINLLNAIKKSPVKLFVNTGSAVEYGTKMKKMRESDVLEPVNDYGVSKAAATLYCQKEGIKNNLPIITLRLFTPFGKYEDKNRLIPSIILDNLNGQPIRVSTPTSVRDFIYIEDVIDAYLKATKVKFMPGEILNIGFGKQHTIQDVVESIKKLTESPSKIAWGSVKQKQGFIEPKIWQADISKTKRILNWKPKYTLDQGLDKTIDWFKKNKNFYVDN